MRFCSSMVISAIFRFKLAPMGVAAEAARSGEFRTGEQVSARSGRGRLGGVIAIGGGEYLRCLGRVSKSGFSDFETQRDDRTAGYRPLRNAVWKSLCCTAGYVRG